jgi:phosphoglycerol transferase MdoB-like AlkP superfamily enzyme
VKNSNWLNHRNIQSTIWGALVLRLAIVLFLFTLCRLAFFLFNKSYFPEVSLAHYLLISVGGLRFDVAAILYTNAIFILLMIVPLRVRFNPVYQNVAAGLFYITNGIALAANISDFIYFRFTGRRTTADVFQQFENEQNMSSLVLRFFIDYWYAVIFFIAVMALMIWVYRKVKISTPIIQRSVVFYSTGVLAIPLVAVLILGGVRGGFGDARPLTISDAGKYVKDPAHVSLVLNTPFAIYRTASKPKIKKVKYFSSEEELANYYNPIHTTNDTTTMQKLNVVVIVLESFSKEYIGFFNGWRENGTYKGYTPFLDSLLQYSKSFQYSFANGRKSIDALPSVIASIPPMVGVPYVLSPFSGNRINSLGTLLKEEGYQTHFFHGAPNGSMGFEAFMNMAGIDNYYGMTEYGNDADYDGWWGIWDEKFMQYMAQTQQGFQEPFLSVFFSLSSHHPYSIPKVYEQQFKGGSKPILRCIQYTDNSLRKYFKKISTAPWFNNTLFVLTADHTSSNILFDESRTSAGLFSVPVFFYRPDNSLGGKDSTIIQQTDIMPSVLGYLNCNKNYITFGRNIFTHNKEPLVWNYENNVYQLFKGDFLLQFDGTRTVALYNFKGDLRLQNNLAESNLAVVRDLEQIMKAIIQQYNNRMVENRMTTTLSQK